MKLHPFSPRRIYLIMLIFAAGIAALTMFLLSRSMTPNQLRVIQEWSVRKILIAGTDSPGKRMDNYVLYHDFNKDGISETVRSSNNQEKGAYSVSVYDFSGYVIDQCNYREGTYFNLIEQWLFFGDSNGDNLDEVFAFTQKDDSLFLYIHDLHLKRVVLDRRFLLKAEKHPTTSSRFTIYVGGLLDLGEGKKGIVFAAAMGGHLQSRGVYIFNIEEKKIEKRFETNAWWNALILYDLTGDGKEDIILSANATGNFHQPVPYGDQQCWLFVQDQNLKPIFQPLSFGEYPSELSCTPMEIGSQRYLLCEHRIGYDKNLPDLLFLVNSDGKVLPKKEFRLSRRDPYDPFVVSQTTNTPSIYTWLGKNEIIELDERLQIIRKKETPFEEIVVLEITDFDRDGKRELLCKSKQHISVFSEELELLASFPKSSQLGVVTLRHRGPGLPVDIGLNGDAGFYLFAFEKNMNYSFLPLFGIGMWGFLFLLLIGTYKVSSRLFAHFKYHRFSLVDSPEAVLMLDHAGIITRTNSRIEELLNTSELLLSKHFSEALNEAPQLVNLIQQCLNTDKAMQKNVLVTKGNNSFECKASITPFTSGLKFLTCYLVEIRPDTESVLSDKLQIWSKAAAKMVHDIKYPLSIASVKLDTLRTRLENAPTAENDRIEADIRTIRDEINRVHAITKSFLKFSDIEKPNFEKVDICDIIQKAVQRFRTYTGENLQIKTAIDDGIKKVRADAQQIEFVVGALIENSIEALNGAGLIKISAALAQYLEKSFQEMVEVEVADTGPGISSDLADSIFKPHVTTKAQGTGMGLAGAKKIIEDHGGSIGLYSKKGFGTVIRFSLPVDQ